MKIAGLDIGTTGTKLTVFDGNGKYLDRAYRDYPVNRAGVHEIDTGVILNAVYSVLEEIGGKYPDIAGIGVTSFGETFVMTDKKGEPLAPAMLYTDPRGDEECALLKERVGTERLVDITGVNPHSTYSLPKIMWMKRNRPDVYEKAGHIFLIEDFVVYHLTGTAQIDYSLAARTMGFDITNLCFCQEIFDAAQIDISLMSRPVPTGTPAGQMLADVAEKAGFAERPLVVSISHDQVSAAVGAGVFTSDVAVDGTGTVECITPVFDSLPDLQIMSRNNIAVVPYVIPGKYVAYAFSYTGGALIQWCVDNLCKKEKETAQKTGTSVNQMMEGEVSDPTGLLVLPHFAGAATPYMDAESKGAILGLDTSTTTKEIYKGCMEGVVYEMMINMDCVKAVHDGVKMLHATGGGARSAVWSQMKADMLNIPITELKTLDAGTVGSAMLTGIAAGCFKDLDDAVEKMVEKKKIYYPDSDRHEKYMVIYSRYQRLYEAVRPLV